MLSQECRADCYVGLDLGTSGCRAVAIDRDCDILAEARAPEKPDQSRIERLREAIANGELKIDAKKIAARMMEEEY